jgi:hypothetical protein
MRAIVGALVVMSFAVAGYCAELPEAMLGDDVSQATVVDLTRFNQAQFKLAAKVVLGDKASAANVVEGGLRPLQGVIDAGAVTFAQASTNGKTLTMPLVFIEAKPENQQAVEQAAQKLFGRATTLENGGRWMTVKFGGGKAPTSMPATVESPVVREAFGATANRALRLVIIPSEKERKEVAQEGKSQPQAVRNFFAAAMNARYLTLAVDLGEKPEIEAVACMTDEAGATKLVEAAQGLATTNDADLAPFKPLLAAVTPQQEGKMVRLLVKTEELAAIGKVMGPMLEAMQQASAKRAEAAREASKAPLPDPMRAASAAQMRLILQQIITFDLTNHRLPADLNELLRSGIVPDGGTYELMNPRTNEERGYLYVKPKNVNRLSEIKEPSKTAILYESEEGSPAADGLVGYADGHVEDVQKTTQVEKGK